MKRFVLMGAMCAAVSVGAVRPVPASSGFATELTQTLNNIELLVIGTIEQSALAQEVIQVSNQVTMIEGQIRDYVNQIENTVGVVQQEWGDVVERFDRLHNAYEKAGSLVAKAKNIDVRLKDAFSGDSLYDGSVLSQFKFGRHYDEWVGATRDTVDTALSAAALTIEDVGTEAKLLHTLEDMSRTAVGRQQALEVGNQLAGSLARQMGQLRGLVAAQTESMAVFQAAYVAPYDQYNRERLHMRQQVEDLDPPDAIDWVRRAADGEIE